MKPTSGKALTEKTKEIIENNLNFGIGIDINKKTYDLIERGTTLSKEDLREWLKGRIEKAVKASEQSLTIDRELMKERTVECVFNSGRANSFRELLALLGKEEK